MPTAVQGSGASANQDASPRPVRREPKPEPRQEESPPPKSENKVDKRA
jgi:hypothetical protein